MELLNKMAERNKPWFISEIPQVHRYVHRHTVTYSQLHMHLSMHTLAQTCTHTHTHIFKNKISVALCIPEASSTRSST